VIEQHVLEAVARILVASVKKPPQSARYPAMLRPPSESLQQVSACGRHVGDLKVSRSEMTEREQEGV
jgi:hypothetical protein